MPIITVYPDVIRAYNRVEIDWADMPTVEWARVLRVDAVTGECTPLRPYICYNGDYLNVSCDGHGIFWDTEVPLDRSVYYITEGLDANLVQPCIAPGDVLFDSYGRIVVNGWGTADSGQTTTTIGGVAGDYSVNGTFGQIATSTTGASRRVRYAESVTNPDLRVTLVAGPTALTQPYEMGLIARRDPAANTDYSTEVVFNPGGSIFLQIRKTVAGVGTTLITSGFAAATITPGRTLRLRFTVVGSTLTATVADDDTFDPTDTSYLTLTTTDTEIPGPGQVGVRVYREVGNTNGTITHQFDNLVLSGSCLPCEPVTATSEPSTMASNGAFRLKDPVRPCNDLYVPLCFDQTSAPECLPGSGIFFAQMDTESYDANSLILNPTNASRPIAVTRVRRDKASLLQLVTRTFADRDNLLRINEAGSPLLLQGPPDYGIPDAYISVGTISIERGLTDHRFPIRVNNLPFLTVNRPAGPSLGVCGSRVQDTCDIYDSWSELADEGFTYEDMVRGLASFDGNPPVQDLRNWNDVNNDFADWDAVESGNTWVDVRAGD